METISSVKYNQSVIADITRYLKDNSLKGEPIDFEVWVDGYKAIRRTNDRKQFTTHERFINAATKTIEVHLFNGEIKNNDKQILVLQLVPKNLSEDSILENIETKVLLKIKEQQVRELEAKTSLLFKQIGELECIVSELRSKLPEQPRTFR